MGTPRALSPWFTCSHIAKRTTSSTTKLLASLSWILVACAISRSWLRDSPSCLLQRSIVSFTLPGLRSHTLRTRAFSSLALLHPCTPSPSLVPRPGLAHPGLKQSCRQNGQKRNLPSTSPEPYHPSAPRAPSTDSTLTKKSLTKSL